MADTPFPGSLAGSSLNCTGGQEAVQTQTQHGASRTFNYLDRGSASSPYLGQALASAPGADATMAAIKDALSSCAQSTSNTAADTAPESSLVEVAAPIGAGDQAFAFRQTTRQSAGGISASVTIDLVVVRNGTTIEMYLLTDIPAAGGHTSEQFTSIIQAGDAKVAKAG